MQSPLEPTGLALDPKPPAALVFHDVDHEYYVRRSATVRALAGIELALATGEFVSVVGPSGCGKTTLLRLAVGLLRPSRGTVSIGGEPVRSPRRDVSFIFQDAVMLPWFSVMENVTLPIRIAGGDMAMARLRAGELLDRVGLTGFHNATPMQLSGGMRQRAAIVRALMTRPRILLMDEPFGALDALTREQMNLDLASIAEASGCTVLLITHGISEAVFLANRVVVMTPRPGRIAEMIDIPLPRPRNRRTLAAPEFAALCDRVREHFQHPGSEMASAYE